MLRKYYRAQAVLQAFRKNSVTTEQRAARERAGKLSIGRLFKRNAEKKTPPPKSPHVIGKMKSFKFLNKVPPKGRKIKLDKIDKADFSSPSVDDFNKQLEKSLKAFVVRREIVVSDLNARCATSITFTKRNAFMPPRAS